jgi:ketosteroid isomerase-like protein
MTTDRGQIETLLHDLYAARAGGDLAGVLASFSPEAKLEIRGASNANPISVIAVGLTEFRPWLALMIKTFRIVDHTTLSILIDGAGAAVHWRAQIVSRITGASVPTEFVDLVQIEGGRIAAYTEFFVPS